MDTRKRLVSRAARARVSVSIGLAAGALVVAMTPGIAQATASPSACVGTFISTVATTYQGFPLGHFYQPVPGKAIVEEIRELSCTAD